MEKTVKELIENILYAPNDNEYYIANIDDLDEIKRAYEKELAEKDKYIKNLENNWESVTCDNYNLQQTQLFKEDFRQSGGIYYDGKFTPIYNLIDNSKWEKLPSKDVK